MHHSEVLNNMNETYSSEIQGFSRTIWKLLIMFLSLVPAMCPLSFCVSVSVDLIR